MNIKERNIFQLILLSLVTFSIYYFYWIYSTSESISEEKRKVPPVIEVLLCIVTIKIYAIYWHYKTAKMVYVYAQEQGYRGITDQSIICGLLAILPMGGLMSMGLIQTQENTIHFLQNRANKVSV
jgi:hypothetical protein